MKRILLLCLALMLVLAVLPCNAFAVDNYSVQTVTYADGSKLTIATGSISSTRASNTKTGFKTYTYSNADGSTEWIATLTATFTYNGTTSSCTEAHCNFTINNSRWYLASNSTTHSNNTATANFTMGCRYLTTAFTKSYTITLSCDKNGNLT